MLDDLNDENDRSLESDDASTAGDGKILPSPVSTASKYYDPGGHS